MIRVFLHSLLAFTFLTLAFPQMAFAQGAGVSRTEHTERSERMQRSALMAWTECIADENLEGVEDLLLLEFGSRAQRRLGEYLVDRREVERCFDAMPRGYRRIELSSLPFAGGLAERLIETGGEEPLVNRLAMAVIGKQAEVFSYTDQVANCMVRGAPNLVADLFATEPTLPEEEAALAQLYPVQNICSQSGNAIEASPLALRSILATASYRILAAQEDAPVESEPND